MLRNNISRDVRDSILRSLACGVVPRHGLEFLHVGNDAAQTAVQQDLKAPTSFRLIAGPFGAGKTFFASRLRDHSLKLGFVCFQADLTPDRRLAGNSDEAQRLYQELLHNCKAKKPDNSERHLNNPLENILQSWIVQANRKHPLDGFAASRAVQTQLGALEQLIGGFDFAAVIARYTHAYRSGDHSTASNCLRWFKAEYSSRSELYKDLRVRNTIDSIHIYDSLKLWSRFSQLAGYRGLLVILDEAISLYRLNSPQARDLNYEVILRMLNDGLQGSANGLHFIICGTTEFLEDRRRGLCSYGALQTRLQSPTFSNAQQQDYHSPVLKLQPLGKRSLMKLLRNIRRIHASECERVSHFFPDRGFPEFIEHCNKTLGSEYFLTPRECVRQFVCLLQALEKNPQQSWSDLLKQSPQPTSTPLCDDAHGDLVGFEL